VKKKKTGKIQVKFKKGTQGDFVQLFSEKVREKKLDLVGRPNDCLERGQGGGGRRIIYKKKRLQPRIHHHLRGDN